MAFKERPLPNVEHGEERVRCRSVFRRLLGWVSVEPMIAASFFGLGLDTAIGDNLWLDKICSVRFNLSESVCGNLSHHPQEEEEVQRLANRYRVYSKVLQQVPGIVMVLLMGGYSDRLDRRFPLVWCHAGYLLMALASVASTYWWWLPFELLLLNYFLLGMAGSTLVLIMGVEAYVSAASAPRHRTTRLTVLKVLAVAGRASGAAVALTVFHTGGYVAVYGVQSFTFAFIIAYGLLRLERRPGVTLEQQQQHQQQEAVLSLTILKRTLLEALQGRGPGGRRRLLIYMLTVWLLRFSIGSANFVYYSSRARFRWSFETFTLWSIVDVTVASLGPLVMVPVLTYTCHVRDGLLGLLGSFSLLFRNVLLATARHSWVFFLASAAGVCGEVVGAASRAAVSKAAGMSRVGAVFAVLAVGEAFVPIIAAYVFAALYTATYTAFPGAVFALSAVCCVVLSCIFVWVTVTFLVDDGEESHRPYEETKVVAPDTSARASSSCPPTANAEETLAFMRNRNKTC